MDFEANRGSFQEQLLETYELVRMNLSKSRTVIASFWQVGWSSFVVAAEFCFVFYVFLEAVATSELFWEHSQFS
jgi:hypothetical protein